MVASSVYLDDIVIWSNSLDEHIRNVQKIMEALQKAKLYVNEKKTKLFCYEINFLGHKISQAGIEADDKKLTKSWTGQFPNPQEMFEPSLDSSVT